MLVLVAAAAAAAAVVVVVVVEVHLASRRCHDYYHHKTARPRPFPV